MSSFGSQATERVDELLPIEVSRFPYIPSYKHLGQSRTTGNRSDAAFCAIAHVCDPFTCALQGENHDIAARRILDGDACVGIGNFTDVARVLEMVQQFWVVHRSRF